MSPALAPLSLAVGRESWRLDVAALLLVGVIGSGYLRCRPRRGPAYCFVAGLITWATRILLVANGFGYFYARLQGDPVPRRYSPHLFIGISVVESLGTDCWAWCSG